MRKKYIAGVIMLVVAMLAEFAACGSPEKMTPPDDTPWNHGFNAIMETEDGYYSNIMYTHSLRFYEKGTDTEIYLCGKPECPHDGRESCAATYREMDTVNSQLYDGYIYVLATEQKDTVASFDLYRVAPDGSAIDRVGEAFSAENADGEDFFWTGHSFQEDPSPFIIHRGFAYIPVFLAFSKAYSGFAGGGIVKMDLQTGQTEWIYEMKDMSSPYPLEIIGCGDLIYYICSNSKGRHEYCYDTADGSTTDLAERFRNEWNLEYDPALAAVTEDKLYISTFRKNEDSSGDIRAYDIETGRDLGLLVRLDWEDYSNSFRLVPYGDKLFLFLKDRIVVYSEDREELGGMEYPFPDISYVKYEMDFWLKISGDALYAVVQTARNFDEENGELYKVYACPIQDILNGGGSWKEKYTVQNMFGLTGKSGWRPYRCRQQAGGAFGQSRYRRFD